MIPKHLKLRNGRRHQFICVIGGIHRNILRRKGLFSLAKCGTIQNQWKGVLTFFPVPKEAGGWKDESLRQEAAQK